MEKHRRKMVAPIIIAVIVIVYFIFYFGYIITRVENIALKVLIGLIPALLGAAMIGVCIQRIKEIKRGE